MGFPGSGKSHFAEHHALQSSYDVINRDSLGTWQKCVAAVEKSLDAGKSVLIDNTNPDKESRSRFVRLASTRGLPCRCFVMNTTMTHALHNNKVIFQKALNQVILSHPFIDNASVFVFKFQSLSIALLIVPAQIAT